MDHCTLAHSHTLCSCPQKGNYLSPGSRPSTRPVAAWMPGATTRLPSRACRQHGSPACPAGHGIARPVAARAAGRSWGILRERERGIKGKGLNKNCKARNRYVPAVHSIKILETKKNIL
jgi:hypothetical protein